RSGRRNSTAWDPRPRHWRCRGRRTISPCREWLAPVIEPAGSIAVSDSWVVAFGGGPFSSLARSARRAARPRLLGRRFVHGVAITQAALFRHALLERDEAAVGRPIASLLAPRIILSVDRLDADQQTDHREDDKDHSSHDDLQRHERLPASSA